MFSRMEKLIKDNNPASYTGLFTHTWAWLTAGSGDHVYHNPHYQATAGSEEPIDIYCVHGTADRAGAFKKMMDRLIRKQLPANIRSIYLVSFDGRYQGNSIEFFADQLLKKILANRSTVVDLFGHSRGGLVNARFGEYLATRNGINVRKQYGFGTPYRGSELALAPLSLISTSVSEMSPGSEFLTDLQAKILASTSQYYFIVARDDYIVGAGRSQIPEYVAQHPESLIELQTLHGHLSMMTSQKLVDQIHATLIPAPATKVAPTMMFHPLAGIGLIPDYSPLASEPSSSSATPHDSEDDDDSMSLFASW